MASAASSSACMAARQVREGETGVRADAGVHLNGLIRWTIGRGLAGLEAFAGTPGSVGGAVFGNAHYGGAIDRRAGQRRSGSRGAGRRDPWTCRPADMDVRLRPKPGAAWRRGGAVGASSNWRPVADPATLRERGAASLAHRQRTQPLDLPSAGCVFRKSGPGRRPRAATGSRRRPAPSSTAAGLKGQMIGGATRLAMHANFIVNDGRATASDVRRLIDRCRDAGAGAVRRDASRRDSAARDGSRVQSGSAGGRPCLHGLRECLCPHY